MVPGSSIITAERGNGHMQLAAVLPLLLLKPHTHKPAEEDTGWMLHQVALKAMPALPLNQS